MEHRLEVARPQLLQVVATITQLASIAVSLHGETGQSKPLRTDHAAGVSLRESDRSLDDGCILEAGVEHAQPVGDLVSSIELGAGSFDPLEGGGTYAIAMYGYLVFV